MWEERIFREVNREAKKYICMVSISGSMLVSKAKKRKTFIYLFVHKVIFPGFLIFVDI